MRTTFRTPDQSRAAASAPPCQVHPAPRGIVLQLVAPDPRHAEVLAFGVGEVEAETAEVGSIAWLSVSVMPAFSVASSRSNRVGFRLWSGQAG
jgi:hypothetical protein